MRVRARDEDVFRGDTGFVGDSLSGFHGNGSVQTKQIANDEGEARVSVIQNEAARVEFVVNVRGRERDEAAHDVATEVRCDVARGGACPQRGWGYRGRNERDSGEQSEEDESHNSEVMGLA